MRLQNYTLKYLSIGLFVVLTLWVFVFYAFMTDEVYDNIDDGLKNTKIEIIKKAYNDPQLKSVQSFGANGFRITPLPAGDYSVKNVFETKNIYMESDDNEEPVRILTTAFTDKKGDNYKLEISTSTIEADDLLRDFGISVLALYVMLLGSIFIINYFILRKVWKSFYRLLSNLQGYSFGQKVVTQETATPIREFNDLQVEINKLIQRIESTFDQQKIFVSNAAHETQTPLAIISNKLELMIEEEGVTEKQIAQIESIHASVRRLVKLNKSLLMLTKIENNQYQDIQKVNFNELVHAVVGEYDELLEYKAIAVKIIADTEPFVVSMDRGLAIMLFQNLLKNALFHNVKGGDIVIKLESSKMIISNSSMLEGALDEQLIYNRFFRSSTNEQSTGLGLALVETIVKVTPALSLRYYYDGKHHFEIFSTN